MHHGSVLALGVCSRHDPPPSTVVMTGMKLAKRSLQHIVMMTDICDDDDADDDDEVGQVEENTPWQCFSPGCV